MTVSILSLATGWSEPLPHFREQTFWKIQCLCTQNHDSDRAKLRCKVWWWWFVGVLTRKLSAVFTKSPREAVNWVVLFFGGLITGRGLRYMSEQLGPQLPSGTRYPHLAPTASHLKGQELWERDFAHDSSEARITFWDQCIWVLK